MSKTKKQRVPNGLSFYKSRNGVRWRIFRNGRCIARATKGYSRLKDCVSSAESTHKYTEFVNRVSARGEYITRKMKKVG